MDSKAYFSSKDLRFDRNAKWHLRHNCYSKLTVSLISIYKHYAFDIADPSSIQDACHMNFVIDLAHRGVSVAQWLEHQSAESEGLRFDSSWVLRVFLCPTLVTRRKNVCHCFEVFRFFFNRSGILYTYPYCWKMSFEPKRVVDFRSLWNYRSKSCGNLSVLRAGCLYV